MQSAFSSTLFLTILLAIGLGFFLRAASKDRTTVVDVQSPLPPLEVLKGISLNHCLKDNELHKVPASSKNTFAVIDSRDV